jgi:hypothetical protein
MVGAAAGADIFDKLEPEPHKHRPAPQHWKNVIKYDRLRHKYVPVVLIPL